MEMTRNYHEMRVKVVNYTHTIQAQQVIIDKFDRIVHDLENKILKMRSEMEISERALVVQNELCRVDFNRVMKDLIVAKKLIGMERYSKGLKIKLSELGIISNSTL